MTKSPFVPGLAPRLAAATRLRAVLGGESFSPLGAAELADGINETTTGLGWSNRSTPGWQEGAWRDDARYDDPKGGCPGG